MTTPRKHFAITRNLPRFVVTILVITAAITVYSAWFNSSSIDRTHSCSGSPGCRYAATMTCFLDDCMSRRTLRKWNCNNDGFQLPKFNPSEQNTYRYCEDLWKRFRGLFSRCRFGPIPFGFLSMSRNWIMQLPNDACLD
jgi:hypothetical protein